MSSIPQPTRIEPALDDPDLVPSQFSRQKLELFNHVEQFVTPV